MELITDVGTVARLAKEREDENWAFRSFLKGVDMEVEEVDAIVHRHCEEVSAQIDCCACANCCQDITPVLEPADVSRLAEGLGLTEEACFERLLEIDEDGDTIFPGIPCPLLSEKRCSAYAHRPGDCRSYPHLDKEGFVFHLAQAVDNCAICPIVFNVFERMKIELWDQPQRKAT